MRALLLLLLAASAFAGDKDADLWLDRRDVDKSQAVEAAGGLHIESVRGSSSTSKGDGRLQDARLEGGGLMSDGFKTPGASAASSTGTAKATGAACPAPAPNVEKLKMCWAPGTNMFTYDVAADPPTIHSYKLPSRGGKQALNGTLTFTTNAWASPDTLYARVWFSRCPGDDTWAKAYHWDQKAVPEQRAAAASFNPCYMEKAWLASGVFNWTTADDPNLKNGLFGANACPIPRGETWYLNVQYADEHGQPTCPRQRKWMCGHAFGFHCAGTLESCGWAKDNVLTDELTPEEADCGPRNDHYHLNPNWDGKCVLGVYPGSTEPGCDPSKK